jgi:hypothetical protein
VGQPITVVQKTTSKPGLVRFEINRTLTGMGHEFFRSADDATGVRPPDELARRLFATGKVTRVHVYSNAVTVQLQSGADPSGLLEIVRELYIHYRPGVTVSYTQPEAPAEAEAEAEAPAS